MELSSAIFRDILSPLAAFKEIDRPTGEYPPGEGDTVVARPNHPSSSTHTSSSSQRSTLSYGDRPTNVPLSSILVTHHEPSPKYKWTIQGADPDARRFFAVPQFALDKPPLRIDVYLPPLEEYHPEVRRLLRPEEVIYSPRGEIPSLGISAWLAGVLEQWCSAYDSASSSSSRRGGSLNNDGKFQRDYESMPFGSRILVTIGGLSSSARGITIDHEILLVPDYSVEQGMLTVDSLREMWGDSLDSVDGDADSGWSSWPEVIELDDLRLKRQFHEAISIVTVSHPSHIHSPTANETNGHGGQRSKPPDEEEKKWIFKSLTRDQRYLYNELKMFLSLRSQQHENIIPASRYIVTKKGRFGSRRGVCGFVLEYFPLGSLKQFLLDRATETGPDLDQSSIGLGGSAAAISLEQKGLWAKQITRALIHINTSTSGTSKVTSGFGFYPDLKPDNIVLRPSFPTSSKSQIQPDSGEDQSNHGGRAAQPLYDAVLIDLEQRGGWFSWSPPEISYLEYLEMILAVDLDELDSREYDLDRLEDFQDEVGPLLGEYYALCFSSTSQSTTGQSDQVLVTSAWNKGGWGKGQAQNQRYYNSDGGFSTPWLALLAKRKAAATRTCYYGTNIVNEDEGELDLEKAQVFMLSKLLWCIFEEEALMRCGIDHEMLSDRHPALSGEKAPKRKVFPEFEHTPEQVRDLIRRCTAGADEWVDDALRGWRVVLDGEGKLVPSFGCNGYVSRGTAGGELTESITADDTQRAATEYWKSEVEKARVYVASMVEYEKKKLAVSDGHTNQIDGNPDGSLDNGETRPLLLDKARSRPTLAQVLEELGRIFV